MATNEMLLQPAAAAPQNFLKKLIKKTWFIPGILVFLVIGGVAGTEYWLTANSRIYIDKSAISAPSIDLASQTPGILQVVFINEGDRVGANTAVARVGNELIKSKVGGTVINVQNNIGKLFNPGEPVVTIIDPNALRLIGQIDEDKGLKDIRVGQQVIFTVDAFGSKNYYGLVDEISPTSNQSSVVFNISDKRQINQFDIKVRFDIIQYPELKNGMSAKMWVYKN